MSAGAPWSVKGIDPKAREIAKDLARRSGMTLGEWLNQMIMEDGPAAVLAAAPAPEPQTQSQGRRAFEDAGSKPAPIVGGETAARVADALDRLTSRIESAEQRSTLAISGIDESVMGVVSRIESAEREQQVVAARFEDAIQTVRSEQDVIADRLRELEESRAAEGPGGKSPEALKALEGALTKVASHLYEGEGRTRDALDELKRDFDSLAEKVNLSNQANDPGGAEYLVEQVVERIAERLDRAEARTNEALGNLEGSFAELDQRLAAAEDSLAATPPIEGRFEALAADLTLKVEQVRSDLAEQLSRSAENGFGKVDSALREMTAHVQAAEQRSAEAIEKMGRDIVRMTDGLAQKVSAVETRNTEAIEHVGGEMSRIAEAVEGRMKRADLAQAESLEKLGVEIERITERLADRITNAERRSAQSMDDVGERMQERQERTSSELIDRMRQSEERTARLLEEAREKIDQRLQEAQQRPIGVEPIASQPAPDPDASDEARVPQHQFGAFSNQGFAAQPFGAPAFTGQTFGAHAPTLGMPPAPTAPAPQPATFAPDVLADPFGGFADSDPFADGPEALHPKFAPEDLEAADEFVRSDAAWQAEPMPEAPPRLSEADLDYRGFGDELFDEDEPIDVAGFGEPTQPLPQPAYGHSALEDDASVDLEAVEPEPKPFETAAFAEESFGDEAAEGQPFESQSFEGRPFESKSFEDTPFEEAEFEQKGFDDKDFEKAFNDAGFGETENFDEKAFNEAVFEEPGFSDIGFDRPQALGGPAVDPMQPPRPLTTQELIAQARAQARAAAQPVESKSGRKGGGGMRAAGGSLLSGFGFGRRKAGEGSTLKTALLMSGVAACLGIGAAGVVLSNGDILAGWNAKKSAPGVGPSAAAGDHVQAAADPAPAVPAPVLDPKLALAIAPTAATAPAAPSPEAQLLYNDAVTQIEAGDIAGLEPLRKAANLGYAPAQYYLAKLYEDGKGGLKKDVPEARRWTERAAANGEPRAMHNLATFYYYGEGGPQNSAAAVDWFKKAATLGWVDSQFNLAVMYEKGLGARQNPAEAYKWYVIAARGGDQPSRGKAAELKKILSPAELASAETSALAFRAESPNPSARAASAVAPLDPAAAAGAVVVAQRALARLGYYQGPADGASSPALRLAISAYQRDQGMPVSGALSPDLVQRFATASR